ncbi:MAG: tetratricopeptide repeat protein [Phycisphaerae bacterium]|nr:tetratricopeptide repeat protein [Phycisphaerae bacterium]
MNSPRINLGAATVGTGAIREGWSDLVAGSLAQTQVLLYLLIGVCTVVLLVHLPALSTRALFHDDTAYVVENPLVQNPSVGSAKRFFWEVGRPSTVCGYYQPLTMTSLMLDRFLSGPHESLRAYHCTSLALHVANTALVAVLLYSLFGGALVAAVVALLFGLHPISVESVCWIAERKTVLATFFALWCLIAYVRFTRAPSRRLYLACVATYLLALLSKPITVPLPAMMLLMDYWPLDRLHRRSVVEKLPLFALAIVFAVITYVSQSRTTTVYLPGDYNPGQVPLILCHNIIFYLSKALYPVHLSAHYGYMTTRAMLAGVIGTSLLVPMLIASRKRTRALMTGWLIFFVMILPAMSIVSVTPVTAANRYLYLPSLGFVLMVAWLLIHVADWLAARPRAWACLPLGAALLVVFAAESRATRAYAGHWRDSVGLYEYLLTVTPRSALLHCDLGAALALTGRTGEAIEHYRQAVQIEPQYALAHFNLGAELAKSADTTDDAIEQYQEALKNDPGLLKAHLNLVGAFLAKGRLQEAVTHAEKAVQLNGEHVFAQYNLGKVLLIAGKAPEGLRHLHEALRINPGFTLAVRNLAWALATHPDTSVRDPNEAIRLAQRAQTMTQGRDAGVLDTLAAAYAAGGQYRKAVETAEKALAMVKRLRDYDLTADIEERLRLYQWGCPHYEGPKVQLDRLLAKNKSDDRGRMTQDREPPTDDWQLDTENSTQEVQDANDTVSTE